MKIIFIAALMFFTPSIYATKYVSCEDPKYITYVKTRLAYYEQVNRELYQEAIVELKGVNFNSLDNIEKSVFLYRVTVLSAMFDSQDVALNNVSRYQDLEKNKPFHAKSGDVVHLTNIARGWMALNIGDSDQAIRYLFKSTKTEGSPNLNSFGPDMTLIRALYNQGHKTAVLKYLELVQSFWNTDSAKQKIQTWRKMAEHNCPIQFQFYDTKSIEQLNLS
ncbi:hypothetical protein J7384_16620 [Endozoicomonas sp. G2_1]|uniref:hypothetical protein n=1 Tax=Endozoicomonas sp. G2_1 TaxID=2821091 RepID=UPI001ADC0190|nr:hypothetical protein [Endozoicomonas sp. G2_1]MBO9491986.1 hypothetical protein [Endozoicomonas sp. G2_1]